MTSFIRDICMNVCNCADCYDSGVDSCCYPKIHLPIYNETESSFEMDMYGNQTNNMLFLLARQHGFNADYVRENGEILCLRFWR